VPHVQGFDLVLYGDSITEFWRGTSIGLPHQLVNATIDTIHYVAWDMRAEFLKTLGFKYRTGVMAIAGMQPLDLQSSSGF
jgi:hypothetical protein